MILLSIFGCTSITNSLISIAHKVTPYMYIMRAWKRFSCNIIIAVLMWIATALSWGETLFAYMFVSMLIQQTHVSVPIRVADWCIYYNVSAITSVHLITPIQCAVCTSHSNIHMSTVTIAGKWLVTHQWSEEGQLAQSTEKYTAD